MLDEERAQEERKIVESFFLVEEEEYEVDVDTAGTKQKAVAK